MSRFLLALSLVLAGTAAALAVENEPADLTRQPELLGREVTVDDRIKLTLTHDGRVWDEILLMRTSVRFMLPSHLRLKTAPDRGQPIRLRGTLRKLNGRQDERGQEIYICDVVERTLMKPDLERLNRAVADLGPKDAQPRYDWARWARRRGLDFQDEALLRRAVELDDQALRIEADQPSTDPPKHWLALSAKAKGLGRKVEAAALAHLGFRARLTKSAGAAEIERLAKEVGETFPDAARPTPSKDLGDWLASYKTDPGDAYRRAPVDVQAAFDHRLLGDALERKWELLALADPKEALTLAAQARDRLPSRPEFARRLEDLGLEALERDVPSLRRDEVETLAKQLKDRGEAERAEAVTRTWLNDQRTSRLNRRDVEGRIALAELYIEMLGDHSAAGTLLRDAGRIDPGSKTLTRTYRRLGYRRDGDRWISPDEPPSADREPDETVDGPGRRETRDPLLGLTRRQVRARLGEPERIAKAATQGQVVEQWIYR
ncbi:MAG: hypothetical protein ABI353_11085, partial [Isosphaeraceae bacterium]